ncbi:MAG TPA: hypothetical protein VJS43_19880 [Candidatus Acidoferrales bacterium]|nr:hypothetical protein [Candidatus Acidoferrales bacterium]
MRAAYSVNHVTIDVSGVVVIVAAVDEAIVWLLPKQIEAAGQGGLIV